MRLLPGLAFLALAFGTADAAQAQRPIRFAASAPSSGALIIPLNSADSLATRGAMLDRASREAVARALTAAEFDYQAGSSLPLRGIGPWSQILILGTGDGGTAADLYRLGGRASQETAAENGPVAFVATGMTAQEAADVAIGARLGAYSFEGYRSADPQNPAPAGREAPLTIVNSQSDSAEAMWRRRGEGLGDGVFLARDLGREPANIIYPETFVERVRAAFEGVPNVRIEVLDVPQMERLNMGGILSVGQGSPRPPRLLIVEYRGGGARGGPVALIGKGITFDSGGISLKPGANMHQMKNDMAGAAAVVGAALGLARQQAPVHVVAIAALAENMPGGGAARPGDVVRTFNGRTIERLNTDAEGRVVLADAVAYAEQRYRPAAIVDVATLTGAVSTALGQDYAGLFSRHDALADQLVAAGRATGEELWRLPLHARYAEAMRSDVADITDVVPGGAPGAGYGAYFIGSFLSPDTPWAHLDVASVDWASSGSALGPNGPTGFSVRLLERFVLDFQPVVGTAAE